jgi:hypothetical protein
MSARFRAPFAAVDSARGRNLRFIFRTLAAIAAASLAGCMPETTRLAGADPADPSARAGAGYRPTIAPYTSMRPSTPAPSHESRHESWRESWRERNGSAAPPSHSDR